MAGDDYWGRGNVIGNMPLDLTGKMDSTSTPEDIILKQMHPVLAARGPQIAINHLAYGGGRAYIAARLSRFAGESEIEWDGGTRKDGSKITGRLARSHHVPLIRRMVNKLSQYVFQTPPGRDGIDPDVEEDITLTGQRLDLFMQQLLATVASSQWAWVGVDTPATGAAEMTEADKVTERIRPFWRIYNPGDVMDWEFNRTGGLEWVKVRGVETISNGPIGLRTTRETRTIWSRGEVTRYTANEDGTEIESKQTSPVSIQSVPFFPVGNISTDPSEMDDLEGMNATVMDLESANRENYFKGVYPQKYLPASVLEHAKEAYSMEGPEALSMVMGLAYPILLEPGDPTPGIIMPDASSTATIRTEINELKDAMKECFGMMLQKQTRQAESAEAKAWDHLDVEAVMRVNADMLADAERKAVALSSEWDASFKTWTPEYSVDFDVGDFKGDIEAIVAAMNATSHPESVKRMFERKLVERVDRIGSRATVEEMAEMREDIASHESDPVMIDIDAATQGDEDEGEEDEG